MLTGLRRAALWHTPRRCRAAWLLLVAGACAVVARDGLHAPTHRDLGVFAAIAAAAALDVELGRRAENGRLVGQRPHKGLSGWSALAALLATSSWVLAVVVPVYVYARRRGMRIPLWKWTGSAAIVTIAAGAAQRVMDGVRLQHAAAAPRAAAAVAVFVVIEAAGFWLCSRVNDPVDEQWLRTQLRSLSFYATELAVVCQAVVLAVLWEASPWLAAFALPSLAMGQRALLHDPLRAEADHDAKTGLLTLSAWQRAAQRDLMLGRPCAVLLCDLDHFKALNDEHGHLVGDQVLLAVAGVLSDGVRGADVVGRFGGEEFCVFLPEVGAREAAARGEQLRAAVAELRLPGQPGVALTMSVGVCSADRVEPSGLLRVLGLADEQLYAAKARGRDRVCGTHVPRLTLPAARRSGESSPTLV